MFTCCHPALSLDAQVALTLRTLGGLTTSEIAHTFLVDEATMAQRLVRAKKKIKLAGIPFRVPVAERLPERLEAVLAVFYLIYNEGYGGRDDLADESIRLAYRADVAHARRAGGARAARTDAAARRATRRADERRRDHPARGPGSRAVGSAQDRRWSCGARPRDRAARPGPVRPPGGDRIAPRQRRASTGRRSERCTPS